MQPRKGSRVGRQAVAEAVAKFGTPATVGSNLTLTAWRTPLCVLLLVENHVRGAHVCMHPN